MAQEKICSKCGKPFSIYYVLNGERKRSKNRKHCYTCVPFGDKGRKERICIHCGKKFFSRLIINGKRIGFKVTKKYY